MYKIKTVYMGFSTFCDFRHTLGVLDCIPCHLGGTTVLTECAYILPSTLREIIEEEGSFIFRDLRIVRDIGIICMNIVR